MGRTEISIEELMEWSSALQFDKQLQEWPLGWETPLSPLGSRLSGSTIRKILLLRAIAKKPRLLLLEEPWRGCSERDRKSIQDLLLHLPESTTVVVVTSDAHFIARCPIRIDLNPSTITA